MGNSPIGKNSGTLDLPGNHKISWDGPKLESLTNDGRNAVAMFDDGSIIKCSEYGPDVQMKSGYADVYRHGTHLGRETSQRARVSGKGTVRQSGGGASGVNQNAIASDGGDITQAGRDIRRR